MSGDGRIPGALLPLLIALPLEVWPDYRAPALLSGLTHFAAAALLAACVGRALGARFAAAYLAIYWLSPWRLYHAGFLWEPAYVFLPAALHLFCAYRLRERPHAGWSILLGLLLSATLQLHGSFLVLVLLTAMLVARKLVRIDWRGAALGLAAGCLTLVPTLQAFAAGALPPLAPTSSVDYPRGDPGGAQRPERSRPLPASRFAGHRAAAAGSRLVRHAGRGDRRGVRIGTRNPDLGGGYRVAAARAVCGVALVPARPVFRPPGPPMAGEGGRLVPRLRVMVPGRPVRGGRALAGGAPGLARPDCLPRGLPARRGMAERLVPAPRGLLARRRAHVRCGRSGGRAAARLRPRNVPTPRGRGDPAAGLSRCGATADARPGGNARAARTGTCGAAA